MSAIVPIARSPITIRPATMDDLAFVDSLQKKHGKMVGWMPTTQLEGKIGAGHVLVAEQRSEVRDQKSDGANLTSDLCPLTSSSPVGYCISQDRYFKRDDCGIIYQLNVLPGKQRSLIGASLIKEVFERAAYGCRLFCCWCAQDIEANYFWESLGFIPLAFRTGSRQKDRVHIFWQRRIHEGDEAPPGGATPYWFPSQTSAGSIREDRLVLPIPPGTSWRDVMPRVLPKEKHALPEQTAKRAVPAPRMPKRRFVRLGPPPATPAARPEVVAVAVGEKPKREKKPKVKNDPKHIAAARELRDRYLEHVNGGELELAGSGGARGKYQVSRAIEARPAPIAALPEAA